MKRALVLLGLASVGSIALFAQATAPSPFTPPAAVQMLADQAYGSAQVLDVFRPRNADPASGAVLFIACGGWRRGDKSQFWPQASSLAAHGFVTATMHCRPAPESRYPTQLNDGIQAIRWLRAHAQEFSIDPKRIAIAGGSAGGHLAALIGTNLWSGSDWAGAAMDSRVQAAVIYNGVLDVPAFATSGALLVRTNLAAFLGMEYGANPSSWRDASPMAHVSGRAAPFLMLHGTGDQTVPYAQSVDMQRALRLAGIRADLFTAQGADHGFFNGPPWQETTTHRVEQFLNEVLR